MATRKSNKKKNELDPKEVLIDAGIDFENHTTIMTELEKSQSVDQDNRVRAREARRFLNQRDGQWEDDILQQANDAKPRYTFDLTTPVVKQITGKMEQADFAGHVKPMNGPATKELAKTFDGMVRNIQVKSNATNIYNSSGKVMVIGGIDGWEIVQRYADDDSFDQDLLILDVKNFVDRVWFNVSAEEQDRSDSYMGWKFTGFTKAQYEKKWPKGQAASMPENAISNSFFTKPDLIMVGKFYWIKEVRRELVLMTSGATYEINASYNKIKDELLDLGVTEVRRRFRTKRVVMTRKMDAAGWLSEPEETVFGFIPLIPTYGNYEVFENKSIYFGVVEKRLDPQRVFNYTMSREVEEGALSPRMKYWLTTAQAKGHNATLQTLNTNADPVQIYNPDPAANFPISQTGGAQINPGLRAMSQATGALISDTAGVFEANLGDNPNAQSGVAIEKLQMKGDVGSIEYFTSQEIAICHTIRILVDAIPKVYVGQRIERILNEDGSFEMITLNQNIFDQETQKDVLVNDLTIGQYDVTCSSGPSFQNRQQETVSAMVEIGSVDPSVIDLGGDILLSNIIAPGMELLAERKRAQLFDAGLIPESQWNDEEKEKVQLKQLMAQLNPPQPTPEQMIGQAELIKAQDDQLETQVSIEEKKANIQLKNRVEDRKDQEFIQKRNTSVFAQMIELMKVQADKLNKQANTLKLLKDAMGVEVIVGPDGLETYAIQQQLIQEQQQEQ